MSTRISEYRLAHSLRIVAAILVALSGSSCQEPTEPDPDVAGVGVTLRIVDQSDNGIPGLAVSWYRDGDDPARRRSGVTDANGEVTVPIDVPCTGGRLCYSVLGRTPDGCDVIDVDDTCIAVTCQPATYVHRIFLHGCAITCSDTMSWEQLGDQQFSTTLLCTGRKEMCSRAISFQCDSVTVSRRPDRTTIPGGELYFRVNGAKVTTQTALLPSAGDVCNVCLEYAAQQQGSSGSENVALAATPAGGSTASLFDVRFDVATTCSDCDCQKVIDTVAYPTSGIDTLCQDSVTMIAIDLTRIINRNARCELRVSVLRGPRNPQVAVYSFTSTVAPGASLGIATLRVTPRNAGLIDDDVLLLVQNSDPTNGTLTACDTIVLRYRLLVQSDKCPLNVLDSLNAITAEVCDQGDGFIRLANASRSCPVRIIRISISGRDASLFSTASVPTVIRPGDSEFVRIRFAPTAAAYAASGSPPRTRYEATLTIVSECGTITKDLVGYIEPSRNVPTRLFVADCPVSSNTAFYVEKASVVTSSVSSSSYMVLTVPVINAAAGTATVNFSSNTLYTVVPLTVNPNVDFCSLQNNPTVLASKPTTVTGQTGSVTVNVGTLLMIAYPGSDRAACTYYALIWIESIDDVGPNRPCSQVQFRVCSPIY